MPMATFFFLGTTSGALCQLLPFQNSPKLASGWPVAMQKFLEEQDSTLMMPSGSVLKTVLVTGPVEVHFLPFQLTALAPIEARQKDALGHETADRTPPRLAEETSRTTEPVTDSARVLVTSFLSRNVPVVRQRDPAVQDTPN